MVPGFAQIVIEQEHLVRSRRAQGIGCGRGACDRVAGTEPGGVGVLSAGYRCSSVSIPDGRRPEKCGGAQPPAC